MAGTQSFSYEALFAESVPESRSLVIPRRGKYDFAKAYPDPNSVPLDELVESLARALQEEGNNLALYPHPQGYPPLREFVAKKLADDRNIYVEPDEIMLGQGSGEPIRLIIEALIDPGDVVLTEDFVYAGTLNTLRRFRADVRGVQCDDEGMIPGALENAIKEAIADGKNPKLIYTVPTFQNPQGWVMSLERREAMVRLSQQYSVPVLEDDCYVDLRYEGTPVTSIRSLDDSGRVMYVGSFSKIIAPGVRLGYAAVSSELLAGLRAVKSGSGVNQFAALAVHRYAIKHLHDHIGEIKHTLRIKRDAMLSALDQAFGPSATWSRPAGGLYVWLQMPEGADLQNVHAKALDAEVGFNPGTRFAPDGISGKNCARLCFGYNTPGEIQEGIVKLAEVFDKEGLLRHHCLSTRLRS